MRVPVNIHRWDRIAFLHWPVAPRALARLLPAGLSPLTWEGAAWVSVTPFVMRVRPPGVPVVPPGWTFPETNVRTYVAGPDGGEGLWFLHMEVTARWFVVTLRAFGLPYVHRRMAVTIAGDRSMYRSRPRPAGAPCGGGHDIVVRTGRPLGPPGGGPFERFLTARWAAYHRRGSLLLRTPVDHPPWPLRHARAERCMVGGLFRAAGLDPPDGPPVVHASSGVAVRVGPPRRVG